MNGKVVKSNAEWRALLSAKQHPNECKHCTKRVVIRCTECRGYLNRLFNDVPPRRGRRGRIDFAVIHFRPVS